MAKTKKHLKHNAFDDVEYSFVHRVNPTVKLIVTICFMVMIFSSSSIFVSLILFAFIIFFWFLSHMSAKATFSLFISAIIMFVILALINWITVKEPSLLAINENDNRLILSDSSMFRQINSLAGAEQIVPSQYYYLLNSGFGIDISTYKQPSFIVGNGMDIFALKDHLLRQYPGFNIRLIQVIKGGDWYLYIPYKSEWYALSYQVVFYSLNITLKIFLVVASTTILVSTTTNVELTNAISNILSPLKLVKAPVNEWSMIISLSIRFVPSLLEESQRILNAQASRGMDIKNGNPLDKMKALLSLIIPMFLIAFIKSNDLASAIEVRNYNPRNKRTQYRKYYIHLSDIVISVSLGIIMSFIILFIYHNIFFSFFIFPDLLLRYN